MFVTFVIYNIVTYVTILLLTFVSLTVYIYERPFTAFFGP
jgi:hypothetical protein